MKQDFITAREELSRTGILQVSRDFYMEAVRKGNTYFVKSPKTQDKHYSLALWTNTNMYTDFANGNIGGDIISFVAYVKNTSQWEALQLLRGFYNITGSNDADRTETIRKIALQQKEEHMKAERKKQFRCALSGCISSLKHWAYIYSTALEKCLYEPFSDMWCYCMDELQKVNYRLDILCATDFKAYRCMKHYGDYNTWLLDVLGVLESMGIFKATPGELKEIRKGGAWIGW